MKEKRWKNGLGVVAVVVVMLFLVMVVYSATIKVESDKKTDTSLREKPIKKAVRALNDNLALVERDNKIGDSIPSFGGMFIDESSSTLFVYVANSSDAVKVKEVLSPYRDEIKIEILPGKYSFKELMEWKNRLEKLFENNELKITALDIDETKNILTVGLETVNKSNKEQLKQQIHTLNVPLEAVEIVETGPIVLMQSRSDKFNTLIGGIKIQMPW